MRMDMPDKIYLNDVDGDGVVDNFVWSTEKQIGNKAQYTRTDLAQSLADALEAVGEFSHYMGREMPEYTYEAFCVANIGAKAALANYRKEE